MTGPMNLNRVFSIPFWMGTLKSVPGICDERYRFPVFHSSYEMRGIVMKASRVRT